MAIRTFTMLVVLGLVLLLSVALADNIPCKAIENRDCVFNSQCRCSGGLYICYSNNKCENFLEILRYRQPCIKKYCNTDSDCACDSSNARLICEDHECVKDKDLQV